VISTFVSIYNPDNYDIFWNVQTVDLIYGDFSNNTNTGFSFLTGEE